jgi:hypothetical protein
VAEKLRDPEAEGLLEGVAGEVGVYDGVALAVRVRLGVGRGVTVTSYGMLDMPALEVKLTERHIVPQQGSARNKLQVWLITSKLNRLEPAL